MFGNFDPNKFNAQAGASFNPNAINGGTGGGTSGMSMFNPNAMMGGGSSSGTGGTMTLRHVTYPFRSPCGSTL